MISPDRQQILHLLNRSEFGPAPGEADRVRQMGPKAFLEEQLHPAGIDDSDLEKRLLQLPTLAMSSAELIGNYPPPRKAGKAKSGATGIQPTAAPAGGKQPDGMEPEPPRNRQATLAEQRLAAL